MPESLVIQLIEVRTYFESILVETRDLRVSVVSQIKKLVSIMPVFEESWKGDWVNDVDKYHRNFNVRYEQIMQSNEKEIKDFLFSSSGFDVNNIHDEVILISKKFFKLQDFILAELTYIRDLDEYRSEYELFKQTENFKWGMAPGEFINMRRPRDIVIYDLESLSQGLKTPPHIAVGEDIIGIFSLTQSYDNFEKLVHRLIRQLELKTASAATNTQEIFFPHQTLISILEKFHSVCTQLKNRHNNRPTITIEDEYDVQDVMNALLRINFEDVRKEENTPSYAGGTSRIDFLLKREKIVIEVKKTRVTLKDREVGSQLIIDLVRYKSHPDCKHLICFVYDPESFIVNPRGLENDLNQYSSDEMVVQVVIRP